MTIGLLSRCANIEPGNRGCVNTRLLLRPSRLSLVPCADAANTALSLLTPQRDRGVL
jgi:hypothetical protein